MMRRRLPFFALLWLFAPLLVYWGADRMGWIPHPVDRAEVDSDIERGIAALHQDDSHRAGDAFAQAVAAQDGSSGAYVVVAKRLLQGEVAPAAAQAVVYLLLPATKDPAFSWDPMLWAMLADACRRTDDKTRATECEQSADRAAQTIFATGGNGDARDLSADERAVRLDEASVYYNEQKKDPAKAIETLRLAVALPLSVPALAGIRNDLGYLLADKATTAKDYAEAVRLTKQAVDVVDRPSLGLFATPVAPEVAAPVLDSYGWALFKNGDKEGARRVLAEAAAADPTEAEIHYHLGVVHAALSEPIDAAIELDRALRLQPAFPEATAARVALPPLPPTPAVPTPRPSPSGFSLTPPTGPLSPSSTPAAATPSPNAASPTPTPSASPSVTMSSSAIMPSPSPTPKR